jgi:predicted nucleotidyltransferase
MKPPVSTLDDTVSRLSPRMADFRALGVNQMWLFGSVLRGNPRADSDADVLVRFEEGQKTFERFMALAELLEDSLGRPVELVTTEALSPILGPRILAEAKNVFRAA